MLYGLIILLFNFLKFLYIKENLESTCVCVHIYKYRERHTHTLSSLSFYVCVILSGFLQWLTNGLRVEREQNNLVMNVMCHVNCHVHIYDICCQVNLVLALNSKEKDKETIKNNTKLLYVLFLLCLSPAS